MSAPQIQWYLARNGQQYGPLSEAELAKLIELGHLEANDLLWREGFADWRPAMAVFPQQGPAPRVHPSSPAPSGPAAGRQAMSVRPDAPDAADDGNAREERRSRGGRFKRLVITLLVLGVAGAVAWYAYPHRAQLMNYVPSLPSLTSNSLFGSVSRKSLEAPPLKGFSGSPEAVDANLQTTALWRILKRDFPDWYAERLKEAAALAAQNKSETEIGQHLARALVGLRRQQADNALAASLPRLKMIASTFFDNLVQLRAQSVDACYEFISHGEASPLVVSLLQGSAQTANLQAQLAAVFEAVAEGRKTPRVYPQPKKSDYDALAADLSKRGWSQEDMQLFSDERALAKAPPEKVCQLVHDWFAVQLAISDPEMQLRLLADSLKPVVAG
jgi:hypothetical protein